MTYRLLMLCAALSSLSAYAEAGLKLEVHSNKGQYLSLEFGENPVREGRKLATICSDSDADFRKAVLWMPDMGHGSTPTKIITIDSRCARIERMDFMMGGLWEIRIELGNDDRAVFSLEVE